MASFQEGAVGIDMHVLPVRYTSPCCYGYPSYDSLGLKISGAGLPQKEKGCRGVTESLHLKFSTRRSMRLVVEIFSSSVLGLFMVIFTHFLT